MGTSSFVHRGGCRWKKNESRAGSWRGGISEPLRNQPHPGVSHCSRAGLGQVVLQVLLLPRWALKKPQETKESGAVGSSASPAPPAPGNGHKERPDRDVLSHHQVPLACTVSDLIRGGPHGLDHHALHSPLRPAASRPEAQSVTPGRGPRSAACEADDVARAGARTVRRRAHPHLHLPDLRSRLVVLHPFCRSPRS